MSDPNWFYSTLAQATAAIVGLAGAFLLQRLLTQREAIAEPRGELRANVEHLLSEIVAQRAEAEGALRAIDHAIERSQELGATPGAPNPAPAGYILMAPRASAGVSFPFADAPNWSPDLDLATPRQAVQEFIEALPSDFDALVKMLRESAGLRAGPAWLNDAPAEWVQPAHFWQAVSEQQDVARTRWQTLAETSRKRAGELAAFRSGLVPASFYVLLGLLTALLATGVIAPLFFLTAEKGLSKPILLILFVPLAVSFLGYAAYELFRLRSAGDLSNESF